MFQPGPTGIHFVIQFLYSVDFSIKFSWSNIIPPKRKQLICDSLVSLGKIDAFTMAQEKYSPQLHCMKILLHFCFFVFVFVCFFFLFFYFYKILLTIQS